MKKSIFEGLEDKVATNGKPVSIFDGLDDSKAVSVFEGLGDEAIKETIRRPVTDLVSSLAAKAILPKSVYESPVGDIVQRSARDVGAGFTSAVGSVAGFLAPRRIGGLEKYAEKINQVAYETSKNLMPPDPVLMDQIGAGFGSLAFSFLPGVGTTKVVNAMAAVPRIAAFFGIGISASIEALMEGGSASNRVIEKGGTKEEARSAGNTAFLINIPLNYFTNKLGIFGDEAKAFIKAIKSGAFESVQEMLQQVTGNYAADDPIGSGVFESGVVGAVTGGAAGGASSIGAKAYGTMPESPTNTPLAVQEETELPATPITLKAAETNVVKAAPLTEDRLKTQVPLAGESVIKQEQPTQALREEAVMLEKAQSVNVRQMKELEENLVSPETPGYTVTSEAIPSESLKAEIFNASPEVRAEYNEKASSILLDEKGNNALAQHFGIEPIRTDTSTGAYNEKINPNILTVFPQGTPIESIRQYARARQYIFKQDAVPLFQVHDKGKTQGFRINFAEPLTPESETAFFKALRGVLTKDAGYTKLTDRSIVVLDFSGTPGIEAAIEKFSQTYEPIESNHPFRAESEYGPVHDWGKDPQGKAIENETFTGKRPAAEGYIRAARLQADKLSEEYSGQNLVSREQALASSPASKEVSSFKSAVESSGKPRSVKTKTLIHEMAGIKDTSPEVVMTESKLLRMKYLNQERGAKQAARQVSKDVAAKITNTFREKFGAIKAEASEAIADVKEAAKQRLQDIFLAKKIVSDYVVNNTQGNSRAKFIKMVATAQSPRDITRAFMRVDREVSLVYIKSLIAEVRNKVARALESKTVSVEYKKKIIDLVSDIETKGHSEATMRKLEATKEYIDRADSQGKAVDMPNEIINKLSILARTPIERLSEFEIENLIDDLTLIENRGRLKERLKSETYKLKKERHINNLSATIKPIEKHQLIIKPPIGNLSLIDTLKNVITRVVNYDQWLDLASRPMDVFFDMLDDNAAYKGTAYGLFKRLPDADHHRYMQRRDSLVEPIKKLSRTLGLKQSNFERIGVYATNAQKGGIEKLKSMGMTKDQVESVKLTPQEMQLYVKMRETMDSLFPSVSGLLSDLYNETITKVTNYFPFQTDLDAMADTPIADRVNDSMNGIRRTKMVEQGFKESRVGGEQAVKVNAMEIFTKHMDDAVYLIETQANIKMLTEIAGSVDYRQSAGALGQIITKDYLDLLARHGGSSEQKTRLGSMLNFLRRNYGNSVLGFKLSSILKQPTSLLDASAVIGGDYVQEGLRRTVTDKKWRDFVLENFPEIRNRVGDDPTLSELSLNSLIKKTQRAGFWALQKLDGVSAVAAGAAAYQRAIDEKGIKLDLSKPNTEAILDATLLMRRTQASPYAKDLPMILSRGGLTGVIELDKALLQFQSFSLNRWSFIKHDIIELGIKEDNPEKAVQQLSYLMSAMALEVGINLGSKALIAGLLVGLGAEVKKELAIDIDELKKDFLYQVLSTYPAVPQILGQVKYDNPLMPSLSPVQDIAIGTYRAINANKELSKIRGVIRVLEGLAGLTGLPGVNQISQITRMAIRENSLIFPYARELKDLENLRKKNILEDDEASRLIQLRTAHKVYENHNKAYKREIIGGKSESAKQIGESFLEQMEAIKQ